MSFAELGELIAGYGQCPPVRPKECVIEDTSTFIEQKCLPCLLNYWRMYAATADIIDSQAIQIDSKKNWDIDNLN